MKIFLAGATGVIGRLLLPMLVKAGHEVTGTTRSMEKSDQIVRAGGHAVIVDAMDRDAVFAALHAERPDVVIHQLTDLSRRDFAANSSLRVVGTRNLVDASLAVGVHRMIAESIAWMYEPGSEPADEEDPFDIQAAPPRDRTVLAVQSLEQAVAEMPIGVILRYGILYGPGTWYSRDGLTTEQIKRGEIEANDGVTSFLHVVDAAQAAHQALEWPAGVLNIVDDSPATGKAWVSLYATLVESPPPPTKSGALNWERGASNQRARQLGWQPAFPTWHEGFKTVLGKIGSVRFQNAR